ncbi:MAG: cysteine desulfurase [Proteobacteria bacterium]|nr:cysteine desulfurase [Pseudomonadota bacterium]
MTSRVYLDWNATAPLRPEARAASIAALDQIGNPSSVHAEGRRALAIIERARAEIANLVAADPAGVVFTSGASEANNAVVRSGWDTIFLSPLEHDSVIAAAQASGAHLVWLPVLADGRIDLTALASALPSGKNGARALLAVQFANNETGVIQPVAEAVAVARDAGARSLVDAVQAAGRIRLDVSRLGADYVTLSAHKLGGPKGAGALVVADGAPIVPLIAGGGQESRRRAGTENVAAIAGFGAAAAAAGRDLERDLGRISELRATLEAGIADQTPAASIIAAGSPRLPNTTSVALPGRKAELLVAALDLAGIAVSAGAACSSGKVQQSRVLDAMGLAPAIAEAAIRVSLGATTTMHDVAAFLAAWGQLADRRRRAA